MFGIDPERVWIESLMDMTEGITSSYLFPFPQLYLESFSYPVHALSLGASVWSCISIYLFLFLRFDPSSWELVANEEMWQAR